MKLRITEKSKNPHSKPNYGDFCFDRLPALRVLFYFCFIMLNNASYIISLSATTPAAASVTRFRSIRRRP